jgi:hypothetical protein
MFLLLYPELCGNALNLANSNLIFLPRPSSNQNVISIDPAHSGKPALRKEAGMRPRRAGF